MSDLLEQLPERGLETALRDLDQRNAELKSAQRLSNEGGLVGYTIATGNTWDRTETVTAAAITQMTLVVTLTLNQTQQFPFAQLYPDFRVNGTGPSNKLSPLVGTYAGFTFSGNYGWNDGTNLIYLGEQTSALDATTYTWTISFFYKGTLTYYIKPVVRASCGGAVSIARTL